MSVTLNYTGIPGMGGTVTSSEAAFLWAANTWYITKGIVISSTAVDSGSSPTTDLRPGLVMGKITSSGEYAQYSATATDGTQIAEGVLFNSVRMVNPLTGSVADQVGVLVVAGAVKGGSLQGIDQKARSDMYARFVFDDDLAGNSFGWRDVVAKTADYTVTSADNNRIFTNRGAAGAVNFTLPTIAKGLRYRFFVEADQTVTVTSATADTLVVFNDAAADSIAASTAGEKIGWACEVIANDNATKWLVFEMIHDAATSVIAT